MITRWICSLGAVLIVAAPCLAQTPLDGKMELSVGGSFQVLTFSYSGSGESETYGLFNVPVRVGYFVTEGLELEAEAIVSLWEEDFLFNEETEAAYVISANAAYNFPTGSNVRPFLLAGIGFSDAVIPPLGNSVLPLDADETTRTVLNLGAGVKTMLGDRAAFRVEYRMQSFPEVEDELTAVTSHTVQLGVSMFVL